MQTIVKRMICLYKESNYTEGVLLEMVSGKLAPKRLYTSIENPKIIKGVGSREVNKLLSKRQFCRFFIGHITQTFHNFFQWKFYPEDGLLNVIEKQNNHSYEDLQRYQWIFKSSFIVDSPHHSNFVQTQWTLQERIIDYRNSRVVYGYVSQPI